MAKLAILLADGVEEMEAVIIIDLLRRSGIDVQLVGFETEWVTTARNIRLGIEVQFSAIDWDTFDGVILPGGRGGTDELLRNDAVKKLLISFSEQNKFIAAICAAPEVLYQAGILQGRSFTCYPGCEVDMMDIAHSTKRVVVDGNMITSQGPGTTVEFSLKVIEHLLNEDTAKKIACQILHENEKY